MTSRRSFFRRVLGCVGAATAISPALNWCSAPDGESPIQSGAGVPFLSMASPIRISSTSPSGYCMDIFGLDQFGNRVLVRGVPVANPADFNDWESADV